MQRRYFDLKLDATLRAIQQLKSNTSMLRSALNLMRHNEETGGWIHPGILNTALQDMSDTLRRINEQTAGVIALLGFYYDDDLVRLVESSSGPSVPLLQKMSEFLARVTRIAEMRQLLEATPAAPAELRATVEQQARDQDREIQLVIRDLAQIGDALDELANETIRRMRDAYGKIRI